MTKFSKKVLSIFLAVIFVLSCMVVTAQADTNWPATSKIKTYVLTTKNDTKVYKTATSKDGSYGTIYATDLITINGYDSSSKRIKVTYPVSSGNKTGYIPLSAVTSGTWNSATGTFTATAKTTTYRRASTSSSLGYLAKGDKCYKIAVSGSYTQVIYPVSGGYKMGWVKTSDIPSDSSTSSSSKLLYPLKGSITVTSSSATTNGIKCDYKASSGTKVYAPADGTVVYKQAYTKISGTETLTSYGNFITFTASDNSYTVKMCHLSKFNGVNLKISASKTKVQSGSDGTYILATKTVKQGDLLGYTGQTGNATGPHLHLEVYKGTSAVAKNAVDPKKVFTTW